MLDDDGLIRDQGGLDADRQIGGDRAHGGVQVAAEGQDVAALAHGDGQADAVLAVHAEDRLRRVRVAAVDAGDVAETDRPPVGDEVDVPDVLLRVEGARDAQREGLRAGLDRPGRQDQVLRPERVRERRRVQAEAGELPGGELDEDGLVLGAEQLDLGDVRHLQQLRADALGVVAQLALAEAVGGEAVDDPEDVAEVVVEERPDDAGRQRVADVADVLAHLIPGVLDLLGGRGAEEVDEDHRHAGSREAAQEVEVRGLLEPRARAAR